MRREKGKGRRATSTKATSLSLLSLSSRSVAFLSFARFPLFGTLSFPWFLFRLFFSLFSLSLAFLSFARFPLFCSFCAMSCLYLYLSVKPAFAFANVILSLSVSLCSSVSCVHVFVPPCPGLTPSLCLSISFRVAQVSANVAPKCARLVTMYPYPCRWLSRRMFDPHTS